MKKKKKQQAIKNRQSDELIPDENVLSIYLNEISRIPLLTREEENEAARAAAKGNLDARNKLINGNLRFVVNIAKKYQGQGIPLADLISEGNIGLIQAIERYDVERGYHFISYAVWWIRQSIIKALSEKSRLIRLPINRAADLLRIVKIKNSLPDSHKNDNDIKEIACILNMNESHVEDMIAISREVVSLEKQVVSGKGTTPLGCFVEDCRNETPDQEMIRKALEADINDLLNTLNSREAEIIRCRYGLGQQHPLSLKEIGDRFDLTKERIRQIEEKALMRLQHPSRKSRLEAYVA